MGSMRILYIDLASHNGLLACVTDEAVAASAPVDHRIDDAALVPLVEDVLKQARWSYQDLTHIACVVGPGGFTSLRVAVALANTVSYELGVPSCGIHLSDLYEFRIANGGLRKRSSEIRNSKSAIEVWLHSTKRQELFIRGFGDLQKSFPEPVSIALEDLPHHLGPDDAWTGELIPEHRAMIEQSGVREIPLRPLTDVLPELLVNQSYKKQILTPWYGRRW